MKFLETHDKFGYPIYLWIQNWKVWPKTFLTNDKMWTNLIFMKYKTEKATVSLECNMSLKVQVYIQQTNQPLLTHFLPNLVSAQGSYTVQEINRLNRKPQVMLEHHCKDFWEKMEVRTQRYFRWHLKIAFFWGMMSWGCQETDLQIHQI